MFRLPGFSGFNGLDGRDSEMTDDRWQRLTLQVNEWDTNILNYSAVTTATDVLAISFQQKATNNYSATQI